jgi:hypothetical protein
MTEHKVLRTNPKSKWPFRIVRVRDGRTHKLAIKFETAEAARAYLDKHAAVIERFA